MTLVTRMIDQPGGSFANLVAVDLVGDRGLDEMGQAELGNGPGRRTGQGPGVVEGPVTVPVQFDADVLGLVARFLGSCNVEGDFFELGRQIAHCLPELIGQPERIEQLTLAYDFTAILDFEGLAENDFLFGLVPERHAENDVAGVLLLLTRTLSLALLGRANRRESP